MTKKNRQFIETNMNVKKKALAYVRVSSDSQEDNTSLANQKNMIMAYVIQYGFELIEAPFSDVDSGDKEGREGLEALRKRVSEGGFDAVIVAKIDRFTRNLLLGETVRKEIEESGGRLVSVSEAIDTSTPMGTLFIQMMQAFAQFEKSQILWRMSLGKRQTIENKGQWAGGTAPFGYTKPISPGAVMEANTMEKEIVCKIFDMHKQGLSSYKICESLNKDGYRTRYRKTKKNGYVGGVPFHPMAISRILKRMEVYAGTKPVNHSYTLKAGVLPKQEKIL